MSFAGGLALLNQALEAFHSEDLEPIPSGQLGQDLLRLQVAQNVLALEFSRRLARFDALGGYLESGALSSVEWLKQNAHDSGGAAARKVHLARRLEDVANTIEAVEVGQISIQQAEVIALSLEKQDLPKEAELELLQAAVEGTDSDHLHKVADAIVHREAPEKLDERARVHQQRRRLRVYSLADGMVGIEGSLPPVAGQKLKLCLESLVGIPPKGDPRTPEQRNADALEAACERLLGGAGSGKLPRLSGRVPQVTVTVSLAALQGIRGEEPAHLEGLGPLARSEVLSVIERAAVRFVLEDSDGVVLKAGRARRLFAVLQRGELARKYRGCVIRSCGRPPTQTKAHHDKRWAEGGETDVGNGLPVCGEHHALLEQGWVLEPVRGGRYVLRRRKRDAA